MQNTRVQISFYGCCVSSCIWIFRVTKFGLILSQPSNKFIDILLYFIIFTYNFLYAIVNWCVQVSSRGWRCLSSSPSGRWTSNEWILVNAFCFGTICGEDQWGAPLNLHLPFPLSFAPLSLTKHLYQPCSGVLKSLSWAHIIASPLGSTVILSSLPQRTILSLTRNN